MKWQLKHANLLDEPADALICSANPFLNLSGGVGADLLNRYGQAIQTELHYYLRGRGVRYLQPGDVAPTFGGNTPYKVILHAVAIDAFYDTSPDWVTACLAKSLELAAKHDACRIAVAALATGYGRMPIIDFAAGLKPLLVREFPPLATAVLCLRKIEAVQELSSVLPQLELLPANP